MNSISNTDSAGGDLLRLILSILLPPIGVFLETGLSSTLLVNILLTLLGYFPGVIHAAYIIGSR